MTPRSLLIAFATLLATICAPASASSGRLPSRLLGGTPPKSLIYVSMEQRNEVAVYAAAGRLIRRITNGIWIPGQIAVDVAGNLYVPNFGPHFDTANLAVYRPGTSAPAATYTASLTFPIAAAVDSHGNMFVANECDASCNGPGNVVEFAPGNPTPVAVLTDPSFQYVRALAVDAHDDLFVAYSTGNGGDVAVFRGTSPKPHHLGLEIGSPSGLAFDAKHNLLISDPQSDGYGVVKVFHLGIRRPIREIAPMGTLVALAFNADQSLLYTADQENNVLEVYTYPKMALTQLFSPGMSQPVGIAVFPPAPY
jgi:sugar lactone lactonase YvrE